MNTTDKIKKSWWVILSFIIFINGFGFIYIGRKYENRNWIFEGIAYELPWIFYFIYYSAYGLNNGAISNPTEKIIIFSLLILLIGIIRSLWVAYKLFEVYDYEEEYTVEVKHENVENNKLYCCICIIAVFAIFAIIAVL